TVTDSAGASASQAYTISINSTASALQITTASLPSGTVGTAYSQTLAATGGTAPYSWSIAGALPAGLALNPATGGITGTPTAAGTSNFTVQVADSASAKTSQVFALTINAASNTVAITTGSPLPSGTVGTAYSQTLAATGGAQPYTWSVLSGALPPGITLSSSTGVLAGTPSSAGTFAFTAQVTDKNSLKASKPFAITIAGTSTTLTITTSSVLISGLAGSAYSQTLAASGGTPPYTWLITSGALPGGVKLNSTSGVISGTPVSAGTYAFTARVTDSASATAQKQFVLTITTGTQSSPQMTLTGVPATSESAQQITFGVTLSSPYSSDITGQATLKFQPDAVVPADDPAIQFSSGGRTVNFTIPAGSTHAVFPVTPAAFQTGTVAGTIGLSFTAQSSGAEFPTAGMDHSVVIARSATVLRSASVVKTASGFQVQLVGFSNPRELDEVRLHFTPATGQTLQTTDLKLDLTVTANDWYSSAASTPFGGQFLLVLPFTVQGSQNSIASVTVQLQNDLAAATATANF
ncbi:MAG TPA: Ig domain-containing protein, partial [Bryobacteraceae bacterium]|nr:Ig domain-containing protein [Bryobacteraceae bacterium]